MQDPVQTIERDGFTAKIFYDEDPINPRDWDNVGTMVCWHRRYKLGDEQPRQDFEEWLRNLAARLVRPNDADLIPEAHVHRIIRKHTVMLMLGLYDHSGITMYLGGGHHWQDSGGWDSGTVGVIYVTRDKIIEEYGDHPDSREKAENYLKAEVETYDQYLRGDVYGYVIEDSEGNHLDSCWGFFGEKYAIEEATSALDLEIERAKENEVETAAIMHL